MKQYKQWQWDAVDFWNMGLSIHNVALKVKKPEEEVRQLLIDYGIEAHPEMSDTEIIDVVDGKIDPS